MIANMKDDTATLASVGVHTNSVVTLSGEKADESVVKQQTASGNPEEYALIQKIHQIVSRLSSTLEKEIDEFDEQINAYANNDDTMTLDAEEDAKQRKKWQEKGIYLSETIMQALIKLDCVECPFDFETARQKRREGVKLSQRLLERVDQSRARLKDVLSAKPIVLHDERKSSKKSTAAAAAAASPAKKKKKRNKK
ncbi:hypothetical protein BDF20DRAFT_820243 [Mycotypha africana]|uniref:uncharacterized protein n=1 Tax=Mycotypha africana TaxID=64632 RepID=UPI002301D397|nr:uncharacterized protein BDF20DRAFT_820243 [Mycotypha africana]KAI8979088.1 hypothetical protein BDF20DRAFT_820243 [Mycotypha africana]